MPSIQEIRVDQKRRLFQALQIQKENEGNEKAALKKIILSLEAEMNEEDIAYVEKKIAEL
ncbi:MAG: hypothetical protein FWF50_06990 [Defluviitaleaceae bacterium]|nr:hypothetical protein [Defluviitaleaceae bacterium]